MPPSSPAPKPSSARHPATRAARLASGPSVLDLVRLSSQPIFPPGGEALYRQIGLLTELQEGQSLLHAGSGRGISAGFMATSYGVDAHGVDPDPVLVETAEQVARAAGLEETLHFEAAPLDDLPYKDGIFDVAIGEVGFAVDAAPADVVRELARVTRPHGKVVLIQLIWTGNLDGPRRELLVEHLGARPMLLVEWKQMLRDAGVVDLHVEDWSDQAAPFRRGASAPFHDLASIFTLRQKLTIVWRALRRWGWRGARGAVVREQEIHKLLTRDRALGLSLIIGTRWVPAEPE